MRNVLIEHGREYNPKIDINKKAAQHIHNYYEERLANIDSHHVIYFHNFFFFLIVNIS